MTQFEKYEKLRIEKGLSNYQISKLTGISPQALHAWKKRNTATSAENLQKLAKALNVEVSFFIEDAPNPDNTPIKTPTPTLSPEAYQVAEAYEMASEDIKSAICKLLDIKRASKSLLEA